MKKSNLILLLIISVFISGSVLAESFDEVKKNYTNPGCWEIKFLNIIESDIFESVDSTFGLAYLASDGRFYIEINEEIYLFDNKLSYSYSPENNQVIIEKSDGLLGQQVTFITRLDELYNSVILTPDSVYQLTKKENETGDFPDLMKVYINKRELTVRLFEYLDINEELNQLLILKQNYDEQCDSTRFEPNFPKGAEKVKL